ncbi:MAG: PDZ domain-containing protein [Verrucomicrobia bacterium]|nr:PDZ domain-containing protein [Verrucomicrobiota bacterium]
MTIKQLLPCFIFALLTAAPAMAEPVIGIGVALGINQDNDAPLPLVIQVLTDSPAEKAGLPMGAIIEKINGIATAGRTMEECVTQIRGPEGIPVLLEFIDPATGKSKKLMIVRKKLDLNN